MKVAVIGAGRIGAVHVASLRAHPEVASVTIADVDVTRADELAKELDVRTAGSVDEAFEGADAVVIAAATSAHADLVHQAADAGIAVFCEKPISLDLARARDAIDDVARAGVPLQIGFQRRFDAGYRAAHDLVSAGDLGALYAVRVAGHDPAPPHEEYIPHSGGIFRDFSIHDFDAIRFVTGREVEEVYADGSVVAFPVFDRYGDVDTAVATLRLTGGALGILSVTRHDPLGYDVRMELFGSDDSIAVGLDARSPIRSVEPGSPPAPSDAYADFQQRFRPAYEAEMAAFVEVATGRASSPCTGEDDLAAMRVAHACERSRAERRPVRVEEVAA